MTQMSRRPSGSPPYWSRGTQIMWRDGSGPLGTGVPVADLAVPHFAQPMTVVRDDADALVAWLPVGTPVLRAARADGLDKRADPSTLFTAEVVQDRGVHAIFDQLRVAPTGRPWSVWVFFAAGTGEFAGWYVNLETPHVRDGDTTYTTDHVLAVVGRPRSLDATQGRGRARARGRPGRLRPRSSGGDRGGRCRRRGRGRRLGPAVLRRLGTIPS